MKILLTGSSGFIGSHLYKWFPKRNVRVVPHSLLYDLRALTDYVEEVSPSHIFHCASYGNMAMQNEPDKIINANIIATHNLLLACRNIDFSSFIHLSTSSVYGEKNHPMHETNSLESRTYYGASKIAAEHLIRAYVERYQKKVVIVRPFSVYGIGEAEFRFIPTLIRCILKNEPIKIAPGMHDWIYIKDFIDGLLAVQEAVCYSNDLNGKAVNIGTGQQLDNYDVLKHLCMIAGVDPSTLPIEHVSFMRSQNCWVADNTLLRSLGWVQKYSITDGLMEVYGNYKNA